MVFVLHMPLEINCMFIFNFSFSVQSSLLISRVNLSFPVFERMFAFLYCYFPCFLSFFLPLFSYPFLFSFFLGFFSFSSVLPFLFSLISLPVSIFISYFSPCFLFYFPPFFLFLPLFFFSLFGQVGTRQFVVGALEGSSASRHECGSTAGGRWMENRRLEQLPRLWWGARPCAGLQLGSLVKGTLQTLAQSSALRSWWG